MRMRDFGRASAPTIDPLTISPVLCQRAIAEIRHKPHRMVVTRRTSAADVIPARHFATASSTMVIMPARHRGLVDRVGVGLRGR